ncbi:Na+/H+ antiporter NhaC [Siminovitchia acidinfaciens]|uniref:Na+/H+ antiporter NhaC n=1 Tax=Siminovitchia acidinfaciens TaxID=2321395 RepID=A0A429Y1M7_9BACI|nr:Na+/H+ antiporter NhaC [Siminovitchia acidinfaciens]RST75135.1 Na+/H+ antiporter NhaC [Siminovitchia acidinfaciens]
MEKNKEERKRKIPFWAAITPLLVMIVSIGYAVIVFGQDPHIPILIAAVAAGLVAYFYGFKWKEIEESVYNGIRLVLPGVSIIMLVGVVIGAWIGGGVVATMVFYGLKLISPSWFLVSITLICVIVSLSIGSSWSTMGTVGVAGMGIGISMGLPAPMVAGAIISGSYFGDKMSPLSDTTIMASGLTKTDLVDHIKHMFYTTIPGLAIALIAYFFLGRNAAKSGPNSSDIQETLTVLQDSFVISPFLLIVPLIVIIMVARNVPAIPAIIVGIFLGFLSQIFIQGGNAGDAFAALYSGYVLESGNALVDDLFNRGGLDSMMFTVSLVLVAMAFGGILENTGMLQSILDQILKIAKTAKSVITATILSSFTMNVTCADQYISIVVPARMYAKLYRDKRLHSKNLSRALEDGGTLTSVFVPWNSCALFIFATLGVSAFQYAPYAILNFIVPIISIIYAFTGFSIVKLSETEAITLEKEERASMNA